MDINVVYIHIAFSFDVGTSLVGGYYCKTNFAPPDQLLNMGKQTYFRSTTICNGEGFISLEPFVRFGLL